jgi:aspartyl-tRNA(Asn)/glutamyl-tRNA(Gln) amidotransferase subunit A
MIEHDSSDLNDKAASAVAHDLLIRSKEEVPMDHGSSPQDDSASPLALDATALAQAIRERRWSCAQVTAAALQRIADLDGSLHAFCTLDADVACARAEALDARLAAGHAIGPLGGVPVAVKDLICTRGLRSTFGSRLYADFVPDEDDVVVERLRAAGAVVLGKTNTSEFGYGAVGHNPLFATTRNPWNPALTPGGSSAGSAAAVAARMTPLALGSDGGGSVRIPASLSGVFGIKPSFGRVPAYPGCRDQRYPGISSWESLEHIGPLTRHAADAALALSVLCGPTPRDRFSIPAESADWQLAPAHTLRDCRINFSVDMGHAVVDAEVRAAVETATLRIGEALGVAVQGRHPVIGDTQAMFETLVALDTDRAGLKAMAQQQGVELTGWLASLVHRPWSGDEFSAALMDRKRIVNTTWRFFEDTDFLLTPTTAAPAFAIDQAGPATIDGRAVAPTAWIAFSALANLTGLPAASVPIGFTADHRPIGLQILGRHLDDRGVLALAAVVETLYPRERWPGPAL